MQYNTTKKKLILPEYGRNIQQMAEHILTITDRDRRNKAANEIIAVMANMTPQYKDTRDFRQKLWDHLALLTNYQLDIDYPFPIQKQSALKKGDKLPYNSNHIKFRHYGKTIQKMISNAIMLEDESAKAEIVMLIANHMKKLYVAWNNSSVNDIVIFEDLKILSDGKLQVKEGTKLNIVKTPSTGQAQQGKKKGQNSNKVNRNKRK